jgi:hypothetical protein
LVSKGEGILTPVWAECLLPSNLDKEVLLSVFLILYKSYRKK